MLLGIYLLTQNNTKNHIKQYKLFDYRVTFHDLRHTFATLALARGMDVKTLSTTIGHISSATTLDIYSHFTDERRRMSAEKIERNIGRNETLPAHLRQPPPVAEKKQEKPPKGNVTNFT